jgi:hypothetical protein
MAAEHVEHRRRANEYSRPQVGDNYLRFAASTIAAIPLSSRGQVAASQTPG